MAFFLKYPLQIQIECFFSGKLFDLELRLYFGVTPLKNVPDSCYNHKKGVLDIAAFSLLKYRIMEINLKSVNRRLNWLN